MHEAVLAPGPGLLTQVPAIFRYASTLLGVLLSSLSSMLVNRLLSVPCRLDWWIPSMEGWGKKAISRLKVCVFVCMRACVCISTCPGVYVVLVYVNVCVFLSICVFVVCVCSLCMCVCMCLCVCVSTCACI